MKTKLGFFIPVVVSLFTTISLRAQDATPLLDNYFEVSKALAGDNLASAKTSADSLTQKAHAEGKHALAEHAAKLAAAQTIADAREALKGVSHCAIELAEGLSGYYVMTCPMAKADWLQKTKEVENPYMGKAMLKCGSIKNGATPKSTQSGHDGHSKHSSNMAASGCGHCGA